MKAHENFVKDVNLRLGVSRIALGYYIFMLFPAIPVCFVVSPIIGLVKKSVRATYDFLSEPVRFSEKKIQSNKNIE